MTRSLLFASLLTCACATGRATLPDLPPATASLDEREAAAKALTPVNQPQPHEAARPSASFLVLANGTTVRNPSDLLKVVPADSPTARYAASAEQLQRARDITSIMASVLIVVGGSVMLSVMLPRLANPATPDTTTTLLVGSLIDVAALIPACFAYWLAGREAVETSSAFMAYPRDLRRGLGLEPSLTSRVSAAPVGP